jgi:benzodiazapine receptor
LNVIWSIIFFGMEKPFYAFLEIIVLWAAILLTIVKFGKISKNAALLLVPYILWVSFAAFLNYSIWQLNL